MERAGTGEVVGLQLLQGWHPATVLLALTPDTAVLWAVPAYTEEDNDEDSSENKEVTYAAH